LPAQPPRGRTGAGRRRDRRRRRRPRRPVVPALTPVEMSAFVLDVDLGPGVGAWFTGRDPDAGPRSVGAAGNLSHRRPHLPATLAADRAGVGRCIGHPPDTWVTMHQVHDAHVGVVDATTPPGAEVRG